MSKDPYKISQETWSVDDTTKSFGEHLEDVDVQPQRVMFFLDLFTRDQEY